MNDDDTLRRLAEVARETEEEEWTRLDPRWDELSAGTLPESEREALLAEAESSPASRAALEAFAPLEPEFHRRVAARLRAEGLVATGATPEETPQKKPSPAAPRRLWGAWLRWPALAAAAAAALLLILRPGSGPGPLPEYTATLTGGVRSMRSAPGEAETGPPAVTVFAPRNTLELVLRPRRVVEGPLAVVAYRREGAKWVAWHPPVEISEQGTVRIRGRVGEELGLPAGESTLLVAVGRTPLPPPEELAEHLAAGGQASADTWAAWRLFAMVRAEPLPP